MEENQELDTFFDGGRGVAASPGHPPRAPGPPPFVDKRQFHQLTPGGFGNTPLGAPSLDGGIPSGSMGDTAGSSRSAGSGSLTGMHTGGNFPGATFNTGAPDAPFTTGGGGTSTFPTTFADLKNMNFQQAGEALQGMMGGGSNSQQIQVARERLHHYLGGTLRPWRDFALPLARPTDAGEACSHAQRNLSYFQTNYALIFAIYMGINLLLTPHSLLTLLLLAVLWAWFLRKNEDPNWEVNVGGVSLGASQRWFLLAGLSLLLVFIICGTIIFSSLTMFAIAALAHALLHKPPVLEDDELGGSNV